MNIRIKDWKDIAFLCLAFISSTVMIEIVDLLKGKIKLSEFCKKIKTENELLFSLIGLIVFIIFLILAYIVKLF